jgi:hypothetical protein
MVLHECAFNRLASQLCLMSANGRQGSLGSSMFEVQATLLIGHGGGGGSTLHLNVTRNSNDDCFSMYKMTDKVKQMIDEEKQLCLHRWPACLGN